MRATRLLASILIAQALSFFALLPCRATTLVMLDDELLALKSDLIIEGRVTKIESATRPGSRSIETFITIKVGEVIKGPQPIAKLTLKENGGRVAGRERWLFGSAEYHVGEDVIAFLERRLDGTLRTTGMTLGKFTITTGDSSSEKWVERHLPEQTVMVLDPNGRRSLSLGEPRPKAAFERYLRAMAQHQPHRFIAVRTFTAPIPGSNRAERSDFRLFNNVRWFEPDKGEAVTYEIEPSGDSSLGPGRSNAAVQAALNAWSQVSTASIVLLQNGSAAPSPISDCDGESKILFDDPFDEISDPIACRGVLAVGGYCTRSGKKRINGVTFSRISEGDITFNDGWATCPFWTQTNLAEIATHELGHTIGLGHSTDSRATMAPYAHFDGRGASLETDDEAGVSFIYPRGSITKPVPKADDADGDGVPDSRDNCPRDANPEQADVDGDGFGDVCDNCAALPNPEQSPSTACRTLSVRQLTLRLKRQRGDTVRLSARFHPAGPSTGLVAMASQGVNTTIGDPAGGEIYTASVPPSMLDFGRRQRRLAFSDRQGTLLQGLTRLTIKTSRKGKMRLRIAAKNLKLDFPARPHIRVALSLDGTTYAGIVPCRLSRSGRRLTCREKRRHR